MVDFSPGVFPDSNGGRWASEELTELLADSQGQGDKTRSLGSANKVFSWDHHGLYPRRKGEQGVYCPNRDCSSALNDINHWLDECDPG